MSQELKIRIGDYGAARKGLESLGARFVKELHVTDTYFNQPEGHVLKMTEDEEGDFVVELEARRGGFDYIRYDRIGDAAKEKAELAAKYGVRRVLRKRRVFFDLKGYKLNFNLIEDVGDFLVVEGDNLSKDLFPGELGIRDPEFVTVPFDQLPAKG